MKKLFAILCASLVVACTTPDSPAQAVYLAQSQYASALRLELAYSNLPRCGKPDSPKLCSDVNVIRKLQKADDLAWSAIKEAQTAVRTPNFGKDKITTIVSSATALTRLFVDATKQLGVK